MRNWSSGPVSAATLAGAFMLFAPAQLDAQTNDTEYCYANTCYPTLRAAEVAMDRAHPLYAGLFEQTGGSIGGSTGILKSRYLTYSVADQQATLEPIAYNTSVVPNPAPSMCPPSTNARYPTLCAQESDLISGLIANYQATHGAGARIEHDEQGGYATPYYSSSGFGTPPPGVQPNGQLRHSLSNSYAPGRRLINIRIFHDGVLRWGFQHEIFKLSSYVCREGFVGISGRHPSYQDGTETVVLDPPKLCRATVAEQTITTRLRQTSCPADPQANPALGKNPCYPATGDKARFETDFEFSGRPFTRSYHSLRQLGQLPELAPGWVHAYSDRISGNHGSLSQPMLWTTDSGYLEIFKRIGSSNRFVSEGNANNVLDVEPGNTLAHKFMVTSQNALVRYFNLAGRLIRIEDRQSAWSIEFAYQGDRLIAATDHVGKQLRFDYQDNRLAAVRLPDGQLVEYAYDAVGNLVSAQYPGNTTKTYHYNEAGLSDAGDPHALTGISDDGNRFSTYAYDDKGRVRLSQFENADGPVEKTELVYPDDAHVIVTGHHGDVTHYTVSSNSGYRRVISAAAANGTTSSSYQGALTFESQDQAQNVTRYEYPVDQSYASVRYDAYGTAQERKIITQRDADYRLTSVQTQSRSGTSYITRRIQDWTYNTRGQVLTATTTDPATSHSRTTTTTYCEQRNIHTGSCPLIGLVTSVDGPRTDVADVTTFAYHMDDAPGCIPGISPCLHRKGDLKSVSNALGQLTEVLGYDDAGRSMGTVDANGVITEFEYDARGRLTSRKRRGAGGAVETDDQILRIEYTATGLVSKVTQPDGTFTAYSYDGARRLVGIADNAGNRIIYTLNAAGDRTGEDTRDAQGALRRTLSRVFNTLGQLQTQTDAYNNSTSFEYAANGNRELTTDALSRETGNTYDPLNRLSRTLQDVGGIAAQTQFRYDVLDNLTQVTDPKSLDTEYDYNGFGDLTRLQSPDTGTTHYGYDSAGNRKTQIDARNKTSTYSYDALNRLTAVAYADSTLNTGYVYDTVPASCLPGETFAIGRLSRINDQSGHTDYCYDRFGNLLRKVQSSNGKVLTVRYAFAVNGQLQSVTYPDGATADYVYNTLGQIVEVGATTATGNRQVLLTNATHHPFGPVAGWTFGTGAPHRSMQRKLNLNYQPESVEVLAAGGLSLGYVFDEVSNLKRLRGASPASPPRRVFDYDGLNRLTEARDAGTDTLLEGYDYDQTGNRLSATVGATTTAYSYLASSHRLDTIGAGPARGYDASGNTTSIPGVVPKTFVYADHGRMSQYLEGSAVKMNYLYNGRGEQVRKHAGSTDNIYTVYDESGHWLGDYNNAAVALQQVIWFGDLPVGVFVGAGSAQKLHYIEADALGTPRVVVDPSRGSQGTAVWTWDLAGEAFGTTAPNQDPDGDATQFVFHMRFPGQRYDAVSGLNYNYFRDYETATGRYVQSDPIGLGGGLNTYRYGYANPLSYFDPSGLAPNCRPLIAIPGGSEKVLTNRELIHDSGWYLSGVRRDAVDPRNSQGRDATANFFGSIGMILGHESGVCWAKRIKTFRETYKSYDLTHLLEYCTETDCGRPMGYVRGRTERSSAGEFQVIDKDGDDPMTVSRSGPILALECRSWINELR